MFHPSLLAVLGLLAAFLPLTAKGSDWPQFLGPSRNGVYSGNDLNESLPQEGPPLLWQKAVGHGFSGPVVANGKLILFHRRQDQEVVDCFNATNGAPLWHFEYPTGYRDDFGFDDGPRATPAISGDKVYTFGAEGSLHCLDFTSGKQLWTNNAKQSLRARKGFFGLACSPLVVGDKVLLDVGGEGAGIAAFAADTGKLLWKATEDEAGYASGISAKLGGQERALFFTRSGLVILDPANGSVQVQFPWRSRSHASVNAATPLVIDDLIFLSASYETGAVLLHWTKGGLQKLWSSDEALSNHYATSVYHDGFLYGYHGRQEYGQALRCVELRTGQVRWSQDDFGAGTVTFAGNQLLAMKENGELHLVGASPAGYKELGRAQILPNRVRAYPALANGKFYARSTDKLVCLDLGRKN